MISKSPMNLNELRLHLIRLEDTILFALVERAQVRRRVDDV